MVLRTLYTAGEVETAVRRLADEIAFDLAALAPRPAGESPDPPGGRGSGRRGASARRPKRGAAREAQSEASAALPRLPHLIPEGAGVRPGERVEVSPTLSFERPVLVGLLKGTFIFLADLVRAMRIPVDVDFMRTRLRATERIPEGLVDFDYEPRESLAGRSLVVVEDVAGSGRTLRAVLARLQAHEPRLVKVCALVRRRGYSGPLIDYIGFDVGPGWLVGYGLDDREAYRSLPGLCILEE